MRFVICVLVLLIIGWIAFGEPIAPIESCSLNINELTLFIANDTTDKHEYDLDTYNCVNFSHALVANLTRAGFDGEYVLMMPVADDTHRIPHLLVRVGDFVVEPINDEVKRKGEFEMDAFGIGFVVVYLDEYP